MSMAFSRKNASTSNVDRSSEKDPDSVEYGLSDLVVMLNSTSLDSLRLALIELNKRMTIRHFEERLEASDSRIKLALDLVTMGGIDADGSIMQENIDSKGIWHAWNVVDSQKQSGLLPVILQLLANLVNILGSHQPNHEQAERAIQYLLPASDSIAGQRSWNRLQSYLSETGGPKTKTGEKDRSRGTSPDELISSTLRLLLAITSFAGAKYARQVFDHMPWGMKSFHRFLNMRRRNTTRKRDSKNTPIIRGHSIATLDKPDIRTIWIMFLLSFLRSSSGGCTSVSLRIAALSQGKEMYSAIMKGLTKDPAQIVAFILMGLHDGLLSDEASAKLPRGRVVSLFNEWTCKELVAMYERESDTIKLVQSKEEHSIADVVHHFLLALCTHPGRGVCYMDNGWYGRSNDKAEEEEGAEAVEEKTEASGREARLSIFNKVLFGLLRSLTPYKSPKQGELAIRILKAAPELSGPYFATLTNMIDPKPMSISWLSSSNFFGKALSLPLPSFKMASGEWMSVPPSKSACMDAILPRCISKAMFTRGIAMQDRLSRFATITLLTRVLSRMLAFRSICYSADQQVSSHSHRGGEEEEMHGEIEQAILQGQLGLQSESSSPWIAIWEEIVIAAQEVLPDITHLVCSIDAFSKTPKDDNAKNEEDSASANYQILLEATMRSCWLFLEAISTSDNVSNAELDRLFQFSLTDQGEENSLLSLSRLHALRAVATRAFGNSQGDFNIFARTSSSLTSTNSSASSLSRLLHVANSSSLPMLRSTSLALLQSAMKTSAMFEHDMMEWQAWQHGLEGQDTYLYDFVDECAQRCIKLPYKYIEMAREANIRQVKSKVDQELASELVFSPLLYTMVEQLSIRVQKGLLFDEHLPMSFSRFLHRFLPAMRVLNRSTKSLIALVDECRTVFASNEMSGKQMLLSNLDSTSDLLSALDWEPSKKKLNGHVKTKLKSAMQIQEDQKVTAEHFLLTPSRDGVIDWSHASSIDAKMIFLSFLKALIDGRTKEISALVVRQALENGASERSFLGSFLFGSTHVLQSIVQNQEKLNLLIDIIVNSNFDPEKEEDREMMSNLIRLMMESTSLFQISARLSSFMQTSERQRIVDFFIQEEDYLGGISGILAMDKDVEVNDDVLHTIISKQKDSRYAKSILHLLQRSRQSANTKAKTLLDFVVDNIDELAGRKALRSLISRYESTRPYVVQKLLQKLGQRHSKTALISLIEAIGQFAIELPSELVNDVIATIAAYMFSEDDEISTALTQAAVSLTWTFKDQIYDFLSSSIPEKSIHLFNTNIVLFGIHAATHDANHPTAKNIVHAISEKILMRLVRRFAEDDEDEAETLESIKAFLVLLQLQPNLLKTLPHLVEPVLVAAIDRRLQHELHADLITTLFTLTPLKNNVVQVSMDKMLHDRAALAIANVRDKIVSAITIYIEKDESLASDAVMTRLVNLYRGTLELRDRQIFQSLAIYERTHFSVSMMSVLKEWNSSNDVIGTGNEILLFRLDANRVLDTVQHFPRARSYRDLKSNGYGQLSIKQADLASFYDPLFLLSTYAQFLSNEKEPSGLQLVEMMRTNIFGAIVCCLSCTDQSVRDSACLMIAKTYAHVKSAQFQEKEQFLLILDALRNSMKQAKAMDADGKMIYPLALTITMFVAHAIRALAQPTLYLYPLISRFLLQRATPLDPADVPLLYGFLYASSYQTQTYKQQRLFILRFLSSSVRYGGQIDWKIMRHRHVWQGICMLYSNSSSTGDTGLKRAIEEFWLSAMQKEYIITYAILRVGFMDYLQQILIQNGTCNDQEKLFWIQLICSMIQNCNLQKMHKSTNSLWVSSICALVSQRKIESVSLPSNLAGEVSMAIHKLSIFFLDVQQQAKEDGASVSFELHLFKVVDLLGRLLWDHISSFEGVEGTMNVEKSVLSFDRFNDAASRLKMDFEENQGKISKDLLPRFVVKRLYTMY